MTPAETLTARLCGKWHGTYGTARCPAHDDRSPSLSIRDGEQLPLFKCHRGCSPTQILAALRRAGHWPLSNTSRANPGNAAERLQREDETRRYVNSLWAECVPILATPAETYLRQARFIEGPLPPTLRYHPGLKHTDTGLVLPCMVAAVQAPDRTISGLHRTYLRSDGYGKAPVSRPKKMLGKVGGGAVRLAAAHAELAVGEGIETCLSFQRRAGIHTWAALSTSGITTIVLPPLPSAETVYLVVDLDEAGERAAQVAAERLAREGRTVKLARPVVGKDFNDTLRQQAGDA